MRWGIVALTRNALELAQSLRRELPDSVIYTLPKWDYADGIPIDGSLEDFAGTLFTKHRMLIFIMAAGIVVRVIARHIKSKMTDPGVLVVDEKGSFVISLLSGHTGGANEAARVVAEKINATAVITTSSDLNNTLSVDMLAQKFNCVIEDWDSAKTITAMIVNNQKVTVLSDIAASVPSCFLKDAETADGVIYITHCPVEYTAKPYVRLIPRNIIIGIGCKRGISAGAVISLIDETLVRLQIDRRSVRCIASAEIKKNEPALHEAARYYNAELYFASAAGIYDVESMFESSSFVKEKTGAGSVCEPAAYLAAHGRGRIILPKQKSNGITIAICHEEFI